MSAYCAQCSLSRSNESLFEVSTTKPALTPVSVRETHSFIAHSVNMTYHCRRMLATASVTLYACVALTEAEERTVQLKTVDTESESGGGRGGSSTRLYLYTVHFIG